MDDLVKGLFQSEHPENTKRQILKKLRISTRTSILKMPVERLENLVKICIHYCLYGTEFECNEATLLGRDVFPQTLAIVQDKLLTSTAIGLLIEGNWSQFVLMNEELPQFEYEDTSVSIYRRIVLIRMFLDICELKSIEPAKKTIQIHVKSEVIRLLYSSQDHQTFSEICRLLTRHIDCIPPLSRGFAMCSLSIHAMSEFFPLDKELNTIANYVKDIRNISFLIQYIWGNAEATLLPSLKEIFKIISSQKKQPPSNALGCLVEYIPTKLVESSIRQIVGDATISDVEMFIALKCMVSWLAWPTQKKADLWVLAFFQELAKASKFTLLIEVTMNTIKQVFGCLKIPSVRGSCLSVAIHMLMSFQHSPEPFHLILPMIPQIISQLQEENNPEVNNIYRRQICNVCHCMMYKHTGFPELYGPLLNILKPFPKPSVKEMQAALQISSWSSQMSQLTTTPKHTLYDYQLSKRSPDANKAGLVNLGNTCYMNSIIQALFMIKEFRIGILESPSPPNSVKQVLESTFGFLILTERVAFEPNELVENSKPTWFTSGSQQDCSEYLKHLLDRLNEEEMQCNRNTCSTDDIQSDSSSDRHCTSTQILPEIPQKKKTTIIQSLFHGKLKSNIRCDTCGFVSSRDETFVDIALPLNKASERGALVARNNTELPISKSPPEDKEIQRMSHENDKEKDDTPSNSSSSNKEVVDNSKTFIDEASDEQDVHMPVQVEEEEEEAESRRSHNLTDLLHSYLEEEKLEGDNQYRCNQCKILSNAVKTTVFVKLPRYLLVTLMRFTYNTRAQVRSKILDNVDIPLEIEVPTHNASGPSARKYEISAVVVHSGTSAESGHYYCYAKQHSSQTENIWFLFNDSHVSLSSFSSIKHLTNSFAKDTAYVLIYKAFGSDSVITDNDGRDFIKRDLFQKIEQDNANFVKELEASRKAVEIHAKQSNVLGWNDDDKPPPPNCGGSGDGQHSSNSLVF
ncbi:unnamed protein product [Clavelina lepadiformis]|uniref:USP domain-containing protein n=1 Tax=Clavelina lepadiformis TaxID=159417 RepID=A0ABP0FVJ9_CLALP